MRLIAGAFAGVLTVAAGGGAAHAHARWPRHVSIAYSLRLDPAHLDVADVAIRLDSAPETVRVAMKIHAEYNARYWRFIDSMRVDGTSADARAAATRDDSTLWRVTLPGGHGVIHYRVHIQPAAGATRRAWQSFARATGALVNSPDFLLYLPDFAGVPVRLSLDVPHDWRVATSLARGAGDNHFTAPSAAALLDSPILLGALREWSFRYKSTDVDVAYWPLPDAVPFDTAAFVDGLRRLSAAAIDMFGRAPEPRFHFLIQDGAGDALEHRGSVTLGVRSADLAKNPQASMTEIAHEFFHAWNLVAIRPDDYGALTFRATPPTTGLWWGEGVTMYYADVLPRRAGLDGDEPSSRVAHLAHLLESYYAASWSGRVSPVAASLAFGKSPADDPNASGGYYVQGQLLAIALDAAIRDSTHEARGLDDVMRALFAQSASSRGFTEAGLEATIDSMCRCRLDQLFASQVRGGTLIDLAEALRRIGLRAIVDTVEAADSTGHPLPDLRLATDFSPAPRLRLVVWNPTTAWTLAGLRTGDALLALNGHAIASYGDLQHELHALRVGDRVLVNVRRNGTELAVTVRVAGYRVPRVRLIDLPDVSAAQRAKRARWMTGW